MNIFGRLEQLSSSVASTADQVETNAARIKAATEELATMTDRAVGDLRSYLSQLDSQWAIEMEHQLDLVELGGRRLDEFIAKFGNWVLQTETGTVRIRELLADVDPRQFENELQGLTKQVRDSGDALADAIELLRQKGGQLTAALVAAIDAFQRGEGSLERIQRIIAQIQTVTGGATTLDDLMEAIARELDEGLRDGSFG